MPLPRYEDRSVGVPTTQAPDVNIRNYAAEDAAQLGKIAQAVSQTALDAHVKLRNLSELNKANEAADKLHAETQTQLRNLEKGTPEEKEKAYAAFTEWYKTAHSEAAKGMNGRTAAIFKQKTRELGFAGDKEAYMIQAKHEVARADGRVIETTNAAEGAAQRAPQVGFQTYDYLRAKEAIEERYRSGAGNAEQYQRDLARLNQGTAYASIRSFISQEPEAHQDYASGKKEAPDWWKTAAGHMDGSKMQELNESARREIRRRESADVTRENREDSQHEKRRKSHVDAVIIDAVKEAQKPGANLAEIKMRLYDNATGSQTGTVDDQDPKKRTMLMSAHELKFAEGMIDEHAKEDKGKTDPDTEFKYREDLGRDKPTFSEAHLQADRRAGRLSRDDYRSLSGRYLGVRRGEQREDEREKTRASASVTSFLRSRFQFVGQDEDFVNRTKIIRGTIIRDAEAAMARVPAGPDAAAKLEKIAMEAQEQADRAMAPVIRNEVHRLSTQTGGYVSVQDFNQAVNDRKVTRIGGMDMTDPTAVGIMRSRVAQIERLMLDKAAKDLEIQSKKATSKPTGVMDKFGMGIGSMFGGGKGGSNKTGGSKKEDQE